MTLANIYSRKREGVGLKCPKCGALRTGRTDSRAADGGYSVRRRNLCTICDHRWTTHEFAADEPVDRPPMSEQQVHCCFLRWMIDHDIQSIGERAVRETA